MRSRGDFAGIGAGPGHGLRAERPRRASTPRAGHAKNAIGKDTTSARARPADTGWPKQAGRNKKDAWGGGPDVLGKPLRLPRTGGGREAWSGVAGGTRASRREQAKRKLSYAVKLRCEKGGLMNGLGRSISSFAVMPPILWLFRRP